MGNERMIDEKTAVNMIRCAIAGAVISALLTLMVILSGKYGFNLFNLIDVGLMLGLAYGLHRKSRTCAIILLVYHAMNRYDMWTRTHNMAAVFGGVALIWFALYILGVVGTFAYQAIKRPSR